MTRKLILSCVALLISGACASAQQASLTIESPSLQARLDGATGKVSIVDRASGRTFLRDVQLSEPGGTSAKIEADDPTFGRGQGIELRHADGGRDRVLLFPGLPFALFRSSAHNSEAGAVVKKSISSFSATADVGKPVSGLKTLGTGGLLDPGKNPGSYVWLALADPQSRNGVVAGFVTQERGSGMLFSSAADGQVTLKARIDYGRLRIAPGADATLETLAVGYFDDARLGLEAFADTLARVYSIKLHPQPTGYCTWYSSPHGAASDEKHLAELATFAAKNLKPFGFSVVQIDDHWQAGVSKNGPRRNFTMADPKGPYPSGMKAIADKLRSLGLTPGIWFMPFAGTYYDPFFADHQDWFVKNAKGEPYETDWGGTCLDMTQPGARAYLRANVQRIAHDWGFGYFKMDGLWTGTGTKQIYVNSGYRDDGMGDAVFHNPDKTNIEAYRDGLKLVREAAGKDVFILGCCSPQNMRSYGGAMGMVDAMRIGPDNGSDFKGLLRGPTFGSRQYFLNGRVWYNDPDPVYVRSGVPTNHARLICSWVAITGMLNMDSEWIPGLPVDRLEILRHTMPSHGLLPRPVDLFEQPIPRIWLLSDTRQTPRRDVIGLFNWAGKPWNTDTTLERIGLSADTDYVGYDYWDNKLIPSIKGTLSLPVAPESCRIIAVRPKSDRPQLISTSRHVTQGIVDIRDERWDEQAASLSGRAEVVGGDPDELRIVIPGGFAAATAAVSGEDAAAGVKVSVKSEDGLARVTIESPVSRAVAWNLRFNRAAK